MTATIIISVSTATAVPKITETDIEWGSGGSEAHKVERVRTEMRKLQQAAEKYASHHKGVYPTSITDAFMSYFPCGADDDFFHSTLSKFYNPYTRMAFVPIIGEVKDVVATRQSVPAPLAAGMLEYSPIGNGRSYAIRAGGKNGRALPNRHDPKHTLVLTSNPRMALTANMLACQWAAETCAEENNGVYPKSLKELLNFLPGASKDRKSAGYQFMNPFTRQLAWPVLGAVTEPVYARSQKAAPLAKGAIEYTPIGTGKAYAIRGGDADGTALSCRASGFATLVLSNDGQLKEFTW